MGLYTLSRELTAGWEIAACLTLSPSVLTHLTPQQGSPTTPPNFTWGLSSHVPHRDHRGNKMICVWGRGGGTTCCDAGRSHLGGCHSSVCAAVRPESGGGGCPAERGGGQTGGPLLLRCGRSDRGGAAPGGVGRSTRHLGCAETQRIPFLERQTVSQVF